jgi:hypothetical protein
VACADVVVQGVTRSDRELLEVQALVGELVNLWHNLTPVQGRVLGGTSAVAETPAKELPSTDAPLEATPSQINSLGP